MACVFSVPGCVTTLYATNNYSALQSPGFPAGYPNNLNCLWTITTDAERHILIGLSSLYIENGYDFLRLYDRMFIVTFRACFPDWSIFISMWRNVNVGRRQDMFSWINSFQQQSSNSNKWKSVEKSSFMDSPLNNRHGRLVIGWRRRLRCIA